MKHIIRLVLALMVAASLSACATKSEPAPTTPPPPVHDPKG